jgi:hypothetical protein
MVSVFYMVTHVKIIVNVEARDVVFDLIVESISGPLETPRTCRGTRRTLVTHIE